MSTCGAPGPNRSGRASCSEAPAGFSRRYIFAERHIEADLVRSCTRYQPVCSQITSRTTTPIRILRGVKPPATLKGFFRLSLLRRNAKSSKIRGTATCGTTARGASAPRGHVRRRRHHCRRRRFPRGHHRRSGYSKAYLRPSNGRVPHRLRHVAIVRPGDRSQGAKTLHIGTQASSINLKLVWKQTFYISRSRWETVARPWVRCRVMTGHCRRHITQVFDICYRRTGICVLL